MLGGSKCCYKDRTTNLIATIIYLSLYKLDVNQINAVI